MQSGDVCPSGTPGVGGTGGGPGGGGEGQTDCMPGLVDDGSGGPPAEGGVAAPGDDVPIADADAPWPSTASESSAKRFL